MVERETFNNEVIINALDVSPSTPLTPLYAVRGEWRCADFLGMGKPIGLGGQFR